MSTPALSPPRIAPGGRRDVGVVSVAIADIIGRVTGTTAPNLFLTLGRHRRLFRGWLHFAATLMPGGRLPRRDTELVILRVAHRRACAYELEHHRRLGRRAGLTPTELAAVAADQVGPGDGWSPRESAILTAVDQLLDRHDLDDDVWHSLERVLDERELIELVMLVGHYDMLATTISTLRIEPDQSRA